MDCKLNGLLFKELIDIVIQLVKTWGINKLNETHTYKVYLMEEKISTIFPGTGEYLYTVPSTNSISVKPGDYVGW